MMDHAVSAGICARLYHEHSESMTFITTFFILGIFAQFRDFFRARSYARKSGIDSPWIRSAYSSRLRTTKKWSLSTMTSGTRGREL